MYISRDENGELWLYEKKPDVRGGVLIRFENKAAMTVRNITHEAVHAALEIFDYVGARTTHDNQEPFAYLVGWIADCCNKVKTDKTKQP